LKINHSSDHTERRRAEYPDIAEQMDALWHAMDRGDIAKVEPMYSQIKAVKERFPKPQNS